jgi:hypothetical protein
MTSYNRTSPFRPKRGQEPPRPAEIVMSIGALLAIALAIGLAAEFWFGRVSF